MESLDRKQLRKILKRQARCWHEYETELRLEHEDGTPFIGQDGNRYVILDAWCPKCDEWHNVEIDFGSEQHMYYIDKQDKTSN